MKKNSKKNIKKTAKKDIKLDINVVEQITMLLQITLSIYALTFVIASFFETAFFVICEILVGLLMFVIAYNNQMIYKRKYMTAIYTGLGIVIIASVLFV